MATVLLHKVEFQSRELPAYCVVTGEPATTFVKWKAATHHPPWAFLLIFFGVVPFVIYLAVTSRSVTLRLPATDAVQQRLRRDRELYRGIGITGFVLTFGGGWIAGVFAIVGFPMILAAFLLRWYLQGRDWVWTYLDSHGTIVIDGCSETFASAVEAWRPVVPAS
jgi:hypothetical protein